MSKILVTGASGFIGSHLVQHLLRGGHSVRCLVRRTSDTSQLQETELITGSVTDVNSVRTAISGVDSVIHLAGLTKSLRARSLWDVNEVGALNVAQACAAQETPPKSLLVSSLAAAGPIIESGRDSMTQSDEAAPANDDSEFGTTSTADAIAGYRLRRESDTPAPTSDYGRSKLAGEQAMLQLANQIPLSIVRPPIVLGPGDKDGLELYATVNRWGVHLIPGWQHSLFSVIHVEDLCNAIIAVLDRGQRCDESHSSKGVYFVSAPQTVTYNRLGRMVGDALGRSSVRCVHVPNGLVFVTAIANQTISYLRRRPHIFGIDKSREATTRGFACDAAKLTRECQFSINTPLAIRLRDTAQWYREHEWL